MKGDPENEQRAAVRAYRTGDGSRARIAPRRFCRLAPLACSLVLWLAPARLSAGQPGVGTRFDHLSVGKQTYDQVVVRSVSVRSITVTHRGGLASIPLRELPPELQKQFGYRPEAEVAADRQIAEARRENARRQEVLRKEREQQREHGEVSRFEHLLQSFGQPPEVRPLVDLRPQFRDLALTVKDQGRRPSCSVFAVVSALEFQNAELLGKPEKLSEEYLVWATRRTTQRTLRPVDSESVDSGSEPAVNEDEDEGFSLPEVVAALRAYGIPPESAMPNTFGKKMADIADPAREIVEQARRHRRVFVHIIPGHDEPTRIANLVQALNAGVPVAIGLRWPNYRTLRSGYLSEQKPILNYAHAVTLVGYACESGRIEDAVFLFKNSWGISWGEGGYGRVTYRFLSRYLLDGVVLEVQRPEEHG